MSVVRPAGRKQLVATPYEVGRIRGKGGRGEGEGVVDCAVPLSLLFEGAGEVIRCDSVNNVAVIVWAWR